MYSCLRLLLPVLCRTRLYYLATMITLISLYNPLFQRLLKNKKTDCIENYFSSLLVLTPFLIDFLILVFYLFSNSTLKATSSTYVFHLQFPVLIISQKANSFLCLYDMLNFFSLSLLQVTMERYALKSFLRHFNF